MTAPATQLSPTQLSPTQLSPTPTTTTTKRTQPGFRRLVVFTSLSGARRAA